MPVRKYMANFYGGSRLTDCILVDGEGASRYIRSTNSKNTNTPIIAVSAYSSTDPNDLSNVFSASLPKPVQKVDLLSKSFPTLRGQSMADKYPFPSRLPPTGFQNIHHV